MTDIVRKVGHPLKYKTPQALAAAIEEYFTFQDNRLIQGYDQKTNQQFAYISPAPYTMSGLALTIGLSRKQLIEYSARNQYSNIIKDARKRVEQDNERRLLEGKNQVGAIFALKNNFGWVDKTEVDNHNTGTLTVNIDAIIGLNKPAPIKLAQSISAPEIKTLPAKSKNSKRLTGKQAKTGRIDR